MKQYLSIFLKVIKENIFLLIKKSLVLLDNYFNNDFYNDNFLNENFSFKF